MGAASLRNDSRVTRDPRFTSAEQGHDAARLPTLEKSPESRPNPRGDHRNRPETNRTCRDRHGPLPGRPSPDAAPKAPYRTLRFGTHTRSAASSECAAERHRASPDCAAADTGSSFLSEE